jgi:hypothetical protein
MPNPGGPPAAHILHIGTNASDVAVVVTWHRAFATLMDHTRAQSASPSPSRPSRGRGGSAVPMAGAPPPRGASPVSSAFLRSTAPGAGSGRCCAAGARHTRMSASTQRQQHRRRGAPGRGGRPRCCLPRGPAARGRRPSRRAARRSTRRGPSGPAHPAPAGRDATSEQSGACGSRTAHGTHIFFHAPPRAAAAAAAARGGRHARQRRGGAAPAPGLRPGGRSSRGRSSSRSRRVRLHAPRERARPSRRRDGRHAHHDARHLRAAHAQPRHKARKHRDPRTGAGAAGGAASVVTPGGMRPSTWLQCRQ